MSSTGGTRATRLRDELSCPACDYLLRGLPGDVVTCPECGHSCDLAAMMSRQWTGSWYEAPGFNRLLHPLVWLSIMSFIVLIAFMYEAEQNTSGLIAVLICAGVMTVWLVMLIRVRDVPREGQGMRLALLAHVLFTGYLGGVIAFIWLIANALIASDPVLKVMFLSLLVAPAALLWLMRRGEKYIAEQCLKAWLNRPLDAE